MTVCERAPGPPRCLFAMRGCSTCPLRDAGRAPPSTTRGCRTVQLEPGESDAPLHPVAFPSDGQCPNCGAHDAFLYDHACADDLPGVLHCGCFYTPYEGQGYCAARGDCVCAALRDAQEAAALRAEQDEATARALAGLVRAARGPLLERLEAAVRAVFASDEA